MQAINPTDDRFRHGTRRQFFARSSLGLGTAALSTLLSESAEPHFTPKAKRIIYLFQNGGPTHIDLFDHKPKMEAMRGKDIPPEIRGDKRLSTMTAGQTAKPVLPSIAKFSPRGKCGAMISDLMPNIASIADDLCFVHSMHTEQVNHAPAITFFLTGGEQPGRPSMGAWLTYGLGSISKNLPAFVVMTSRDKEASCGQIFYDFYWGAGFLPSKFQGVKFRGEGEPVLYLADPAGISRSQRRTQLDTLAALNEQSLTEYGDPEIAARIAQYEMAYQMQASVPDLTDFTTEPKSVLAAYGPDVHRQGSFAYNCLMARRLAERGVRFVQVMHAGWDQHRNLNSQLKIQCQDTDAPSAALVNDLKRLGLLDETLVVWGGEFGRTPFLQGPIADVKQWGRDHHPYAFTIWLAGGGVKPGFRYGASDDFGHNAIENKVHVHDLQATLLHQMGIDHEKLTYKFQGRHFRLTDVHGQVVKPILA